MSSSLIRTAAAGLKMIAQRLEGSRFGVYLFVLANSFHHEPGRNVRQQAAPGNEPALRSFMSPT
jgi:hypothetical protein